MMPRDPTGGTFWNVRFTAVHEGVSETWMKALGDEVESRKTMLSKCPAVTAEPVEKKKK